jgi:hypothetical protein
MTLQFIENIGFINDILLRRINAYLEVNNNSNILTANINLQHLFHWFFNIAWIYFAYIYLIITIKRKSSIRTLLYCSFFFINIFFKDYMFFFRYSLFIQIIFSLCLIHESIIYRKYNTMYRFILLFLIGFLIQMYQIKDMLIASYFNIDIFLFFTALSKTINPNDFLDPIY